MAQLDLNTYNRLRPFTRGVSIPRLAFAPPENERDPLPPALTPPPVPNNAMQVVLGLFPWLSQLGLADQLRQWANQYGPDMVDAIVAEVRKTPQWQARFPYAFRQDGTMRGNEAELLRTEEDYRRVLREFGDPEYGYDNPFDFVALFENEVHPDELRERFRVYKAIERGGGRDLKGAFYVYAGMNLTTDDLYSMVVSPQERQKFQNEFNQRVASSPLDYETWITRATEFGLSQVVDTLGQLKQQGVITDNAIRKVQMVNPEFARQMMDVLYTGAGSPQGYLSLDQLTNAFELAMIGSAATEQGLNLPEAQRVEAIRQAGIDRSRALQAYGQFAGQRNSIQGMVERVQQGAQFTQSDFEQAIFLQHAPENELLRRAQAQEKSLGEAGGGFSVTANRMGQPIQPGLRNPLLGT